MTSFPTDFSASFVTPSASMLHAANEISLSQDAGECEVFAAMMQKVYASLSPEDRRELFIRTQKILLEAHLEDILNRNVQ